MSNHYILIGQTPVPASPCDSYTPEGIAGLMEWARWFETADRRVMFTRLTCFPVEVSTVFLGLDHGFGRMLGDRGAPPILFETMAFWPEDGGYEQERCATWADAEEMHRRMVHQVATAAAVWQYCLRMLRSWWSDASTDSRRAWREVNGTEPTPEA